MSNNEQTQKSLSTHIIAKQQKTLDLSKNIIDGSVSIAPVEMQLTIQQTFDKALIKSVFKGESGQIGFSVVNVLVTRFIDSFGFSTKLNPTQIETLTVDILENFQYETLEDIIIFLKMARTGKFGSTGRGVDSNLILGDWFPKYLDKKAEIREQNYQVKKTEFISNNSAVDLYYKNIQKKKEQKKIFDNMIADIDKMVLNMDRTMLEETILDWSQKEEMKPYLDYLKRKRLILK